MIAAASKNNKNSVRIQSEGFDFEEICLDDLSVHENEINTTASLIRGTAAIFHEMGYQIGGFDICVTSEVFLPLLLLRC